MSSCIRHININIKIKININFRPSVESALPTHCASNPIREEAS